MATQSPTQYLELLLAERAKLEVARLAPQTVLGYHYDWEAFKRWCDGAGERALPASTELVSLYVAHLLQSGRKVSTTWRHVFAIAHEHRKQRVPSPVDSSVHELLHCAARLRCEHKRQMRPLTVEQLRQVSERLRGIGTAAAVRNRAMLVIGFTSALRRSNLAALLLEDVEFTSQGLLLRVRHEKQDRQGKGREIGIPRGKRGDTDAAGCLRDWMDVRGTAAGALFWRLTRKHFGEALDGECVARIVRKSLLLAGLDPAGYGAHSLRAGFVTAAGEAGAGELLIAAQTGHSSMSVLREYFRHTELFRVNACNLLDL